jgi:hypothetical protein
MSDNVNNNINTFLFYLLLWQNIIAITEQRNLVVNIPALYLGDSDFDTRPSARIL